MIPQQESDRMKQIWLAAAVAAIGTVGLAAQEDALAKRRADPRAGDDARHARRYQRVELHRRVQLHPRPWQPVTCRDGQGGLDAAFFIVYVGRAIYARGLRQLVPQASEKFDAIHRLTKGSRRIRSGWRSRLRTRAASTSRERRWRSSASRTAIQSARTSAASRVPRSGRALPVARAHGHSSCRIPTPASGRAGSGTGCRRAARRRSPS